MRKKICEINEREIKLLGKNVRIVFPLTFLLNMRIHSLFLSTLHSQKKNRRMHDEMLLLLSL